MPHSCCVPLCTKSGYRRVDGRKISFHKLPAQKSLRSQWLHVIKRDPGKHFKITKHTKVCSLHFQETDFVKDKCRIKNTLLPSAVPSIFAWTMTAVTTESERRPPTRHCLDFAEKAIIEETNDKKLKKTQWKMFCKKKMMN